jgi:hypothetical protein
MCDPTSPGEAPPTCDRAGRAPDAGRSRGEARRCDGVIEGDLNRGLNRDPLRSEGRRDLGDPGIGRGGGGAAPGQNTEEREEDSKVKQYVVIHQGPVMGSGKRSKVANSSVVHTQRRGPIAKFVPLV